MTATLKKKFLLKQKEFKEQIAAFDSALAQKTKKLQIKLNGIETAFRGKAGSYTSSMPKALSVLFQNSMDEEITLWEHENNIPIPQEDQNMNNEEHLQQPSQSDYDNQNNQEDQEECKEP